MIQKKETLLEIHDLSVSFRMYDHGLEQTDLKVISDLHLTVYPGEIVAIAGSSGSGKSLLASAILGILPGNATVYGHISYKGQQLSAERQRQLRGTKIALVPQSVAYLDPLLKVGQQADGHKKPYPTEKRRSLFKRFGLPDKTEQLYPYQLSGGMARRVLVSTALITDSELIIADEPTPGMSLNQALEALKMFREMANEGKAVILITHDIDLAFEFADRVAVFYAGTTVETAPASDFKKGPNALRHPYSKALWRALPQNGFHSIEGFQPYAGNLPKGCLFAPRCPYKTSKCEEGIPPVTEVRGGEVRCYHVT
ncbi:ABC transporter ATP-binding protein [Anaerotignum sp.]|nr:ABC transporter ATP-binding protein [Anaerotignum sp.]MBQ7759414.1 ABC transporter ATP-binding protein [Anaerotignum sp.]